MIDYSLGAEVALYSFHEVLEGISGQIQPERFKDKVVIIGARLKYEDSHLTPPHRFWAQTRGRTPGIFIQAATLTTLLTGRFFREPGTLAGGVYIFLASLLAVVCCFQRKPLPGALLCLLLTGVLALLGIFCFNRFYVLRLLPLAAAVWLAYGAATIFDYYTKERKISQIRNRFASFVPEKIIDQLVDRNVQELTEGEQRELAIFFSDIRDFTPYSERHKDEPKRIVTFLNRYHTEMTEIILANNGTVSLLIGDGIFAFFGAPVASSDPVMDAVRTAVQMRERIAALKDFWRECGQEELRIGVGIHVGEAIVGNIGSVKKMAYVAIGDNINLTARIEGLTKEFQEMILLSAGAYERVRDRVAARRLGEAKVKGHSDVTLYALDNILI
jgi:adenylate cyclase